MDKPSPPSLLLLVAILLTYTVCTECGIPSIQFNPKFRSLGSRGRSHYFYHREGVNWHAANRTCHHYQDTHLATIPDEETFFFLTMRRAPWLKMDNYGSFWFGAHEVKFNQWRWQNDETYQGEIPEYHRGTKNTCGLVDGGSSPQLAADTCTLRKRFLCTKSDVDSTKLATDDYYISTTAEAATWYQAKQICWSKGMDLAMAKNRSLTYMYRLLDGFPNHFWIGLQKARYVWESTREAIHYFPFEDGEPNDWDSAEDCLRVQHIGCNDVTCSATSAFVCEWENRTTELHTTANKSEKEHRKKESEEKRQRNDTGEATITGAAVTLALMAVVVVVIALVLVIRRANTGNTGSKWHRLG